MSRTTSRRTEACPVCPGYPASGEEAENFDLIMKDGKIYKNAVE